MRKVRIDLIDNYIEDCILHYFKFPVVADYRHNLKMQELIGNAAKVELYLRQHWRNLAEFSGDDDQSLRKTHILIRQRNLELSVGYQIRVKWPFLFDLIDKKKMSCCDIVNDFLKEHLDIHDVKCDASDISKNLNIPTSLHTEELLFFNNPLEYGLNLKIIRYPNCEKVYFPSLKTKNEEINFIPEIQEGFLFNGALGDYGSKTVLLTDSLELANFNGLRFRQSPAKNDLTWYSWYGGKEAIPTINWSIFKNKKVYFLLIPHSGLTAQDVYETGIGVKEQLDKHSVSSFKFISMIEGPVNSPNATRTAIPTVYTTKEFTARQSQLEKLLPMSICQYAQQINSYQQEPTIMSPYIKGRSLTLIAGPASNEKLILTTMIAASISRGVTLIKFWTVSRQPIPVIYLSFGAGCAINVTYAFERLAQKISPFTPPPNLHIQHEEITHDTSAEWRIWILSQVVGTMPFLNQKSPALLVVNDLFSGDSEIKKRTAVLFRDFSDSLRSKNVAIVITEGSDGSRFYGTKLASAIHANSHIEILPGIKPGTATISAQSLLFGSSKYQVKIDMSADISEIIRDINKRSKCLKYSGRSESELKQHLIYMDQQKMSIKEMATRLGLGESMVKKLRRVYGLSKKRTDS